MLTPILEVVYYIKSTSHPCKIDIDIVKKVKKKVMKMMRLIKEARNIATARTAGDAANLNTKHVILSHKKTPIGT